MTRSKWLVIAAVVAFAVGQAVAGGGGDCAKTCSHPAQECLDHMTAKLQNSGFVGVKLEIDETTGAHTVLEVIPGTPAEAAGLQAGDVLVALNGAKIANGNEAALEKARKDWKPGQTVTYTVSRNGLERQVTLTLAPMPSDVIAKYIGEHMLEHAAAATKN